MTKGQNVSNTPGTSTAQDAHKLAEFVEQVSGGLLSNALGLVSDRLAYYRLKQAFSLRDKVQDELRKRGVNEPREVSPKFFVPLLESATIEEDDKIHSKYAMLLTNARDPNYLGKISRSFVSILNELEPVDLLILDAAFTSLSPNPKQLLASLDLIPKALGVPADQAAISVRNLVRLGVLKPGVVVSDGISLGGHFATAYKDIEQFGITELGVAFVKATRAPVTSQ